MNLALNNMSLLEFQLLDDLGLLDSLVERFDGEHVTLSEDADRRAVDDLTQQAKSLSGDQAKLIRARRDQLRAEISAERSFERALSASRRELVTLLQMASVSNDPELLLADEPTSALDADTRDSFMRLLMSIRDVSDCTMIFASHDRSLMKYFDTEIELSEFNRAQKGKASRV